MSFTSIAPGVVNLLTRSAGTRESLRARNPNAGAGADPGEEDALPSLTITDKLQLLQAAAGISGNDFAAIFREQKPLDPYEFLRKTLNSRASSESDVVPVSAESGE